MTIDNKVESKEQVFPEHDLIVDVIRHGHTTYTKEEKEVTFYEGELDNTGQKEIDRLIPQLVNSIDRKNEVVVVWTSPKRRAQQSAQRIVDQLELYDIYPVKLVTRKDLADVTLNPSLVRNYQNSGFTESLINFWSEVEQFPEGNESPEDVWQRSQKILTALAKITLFSHLPEGKRLHFIFINHEENFWNLLKRAFNLQQISGSLNNAEMFQLGFNKTGVLDKIDLSVSYRGLSEEFKIDINKGVING